MPNSVFMTMSRGELALASTSATRVKLLQDAGLKFFQYPVKIDEEAIRNTGIAEAIPPTDIVITLAEMKAAVAAQRLAIENLSSPAYILGCDQLLVFDGMIYSKPKNIMTAKSQLLSLAGKTHELLTAAVLFRHGQRVWHHLSVANMTMRQFDDEFIDTYLEHLGDSAFISPASYQIEFIGAQLFSQIKGCYYSILGIPLLEVIAILREHGLTPIKNKLSDDT